MIVRVSFKPFLAILDFPDFYAPVHCLQIFRKKKWNFWDFGKNDMPILVVSHQSQGGSSRGGVGGVRKSRKSKIAENVLKHT